jgi:heme-degrading monooxygenase HmoA
MIKVIEGLKFTGEVDPQSILSELRTNAMQYPGFVGAEFLRNEDDFSLVLILSTWEKIEHWRGWSESRVMKDIYRQAEISLADGPRVSIYSIMRAQL